MYDDNRSDKNESDDNNEHNHYKKKSVCSGPCIDN